jgi:hypothetical protein
MKIVHHEILYTPPHGGVEGGPWPPYRVQGDHPPGWGSRERGPLMRVQWPVFPDGDLGENPPKEKLSGKCIF